MFVLILLDLWHGRLKTVDPHSLCTLQASLRTVFQRIEFLLQYLVTESRLKLESCLPRLFLQFPSDVTSRHAVYAPEYFLQEKVRTRIIPKLMGVISVLTEQVRGVS